jgi:hypothetical protein
MIEKALLITENTDLSRSLKGVDRLYFGDQYCEHNHLALFSNTPYLDFIRSSGLPLTLTTPPVSEK